MIASFELDMLPSPRLDHIRRWTLFPEVGCIACRKLGVHNPQTDAHHLLAGNVRRGHAFTVPLCPWHHRGVGSRYDGHGRDLGPSLAHGSKTFRAMFGSDQELLDLTNAHLREIETWSV